MAAGLTESVIMTHLEKKLLLLLCLLSAMSVVSAQNLPDPTRPPAEISNAGPAPGGQETVPSSSGLQSIIISPVRRAAIINGKTVELGAKFGSAKLIEVNERGVVLLGKQGRQVLSLFPGVQLKMKGAMLPATSEPASPQGKNEK